MSFVRLSGEIGRILRKCDIEIYCIEHIGSLSLSSRVPNPGQVFSAMDTGSTGAPVTALKWLVAGLI